MKKHFKLFVLVLLVMGLSCKESPKEEPESITSQDEKTATVPKIEEYCYLFAHNKDTIQMMLKENKTLVTGKLVYNFYEKDGSHGSFEGIMKGDTLYGDYDFEAEGTTSKRELIFLKKGDTLLQGYGDLEVDDQNTTVFKKGAEITFDENFPLTAVDCNKLNF